MHFINKNSRTPKTSWKCIALICALNMAGTINTYAFPTIEQCIIEINRWSRIIATNINFYQQTGFLTAAINNWPASLTLPTGIVLYFEPLPPFIGEVNYISDGWIVTNGVSERVVSITRTFRFPNTPMHISDRVTTLLAIYCYASAPLTMEASLQQPLPAFSQLIDFLGWSN